MKPCPGVFFQGCLVVLITCLAGCRQVPQKNSANPLISELETHLNQTDSTWMLMIKSDDNKIANLLRLNKELQLIDGSNPDSLLRLEKQITALPLFRYNRITMRDSRLIDRYDSATNEVLSKVKKETASNPNAIKYQIINQLMSEIQAADDSILYFRKEYDRSIDGFNQFVRKNKKALKSSYPDFDSLKNYSLFRLVP